MKNIYVTPVIIVILIMSAFKGYSQSPEGFTFQAEARDNRGRILSNAMLDIKATIIKGSPTSEADVWDENYQVKTDKYGLFTMIIGDLDDDEILDDGPFSPGEFDRKIHEFAGIIGDKPFLSTEICVNAGFLQTDAYKLAFSYAMLYHKNMAMLNAIGIMYCWTLLDYTQPSFAATRTLFTLDHSNDMQPIASGFQLRTFGAFSRHILKGMKRVEVLQESSDLLVTAYVGEKSNTMVILNPSNKPVELEIQWKNNRFKVMEKTSFYLNNQYSEVPDTIMIEPGEIITLF